ncbi:MAG: U32 family peptidase [Bacteroidales bacterium]|nr:U32 family peptidase [Bacteroidales bacterium]
MRQLELLAPAKNLSVGIAAIDCGADAVYIAGSSFGARKDAGNSVEDIAKLCAYAHRYGARIFAAVNTLVYEHELSSVAELVSALQEAGVDALIVQDLSLLALAAKGEITVPLHASTQCAIRDVDSARRYAEAGFSRLILERQLSLREIRRIREATATTEVELECFVHGALCVCYSGQCYLSEALCERSANRGECVQACRSRYTLYDEKGRAMLKDKAVLSLKDLNLLSRLEDLAAEGVSSFKIEGRLKNESYVRNVVTAYSQALDAFIAARPDEFQRASFGRVETRFVPQLDKTFNRGYTQLYLDGKKGVAGTVAKAGASDLDRRSGADAGWASMDAPKGMGEYLGTVLSFGRNFVEMEGFASLRLTPGDGLSFVAKDGSIEGFRVDTVQSPVSAVQAVISAPVARVGCQPPASIYKGARIFRNLDVAFEKQLASQPSKRTMGVEIRLAVQGNLPTEGLSHQDALPSSQETSQWQLTATAVSEDGREAVVRRTIEAPVASNQARMQSLLQEQLSKNTGHYRCRFVPVSAATVSAVVSPEDGFAQATPSASSSVGEPSTAVPTLPLLAVATLNELRRQLCEQLETQAVHAHPLHYAKPAGKIAASDFSYKANLSNSLAASVCKFSSASDSAGLAISKSSDGIPSAGTCIPTVPLNAFELNHQPDAELMRTRYCVRHELGLCPFRQQTKPVPGRLSGTVPGGSSASLGRTAAPLFLENNGRRFRLDFDCPRCEMTLKAL